MTEQKVEQARKQREGLVFGRYGRVLGFKDKRKKHHRQKSNSPHHKHHPHHSSESQTKTLLSGIDPSAYLASLDGPKIPLGLSNLDNNSAGGPNKKVDVQDSILPLLPSPDFGLSSIEPLKNNSSPGKRQRLPSSKVKSTKKASQELIQVVTSEETKRGDNVSNNQQQNTNDGQSTG